MKGGYGFRDLIPLKLASINTTKQKSGGDGCQQGGDQWNKQTDRQTYNHTYIATCSLNWPRDRLSTNIVIQIHDTLQKPK